MSQSTALTHAAVLALSLPQTFDENDSRVAYDRCVCRRNRLLSRMEVADELGLSYADLVVGDTEEFAGLADELVRRISQARRKARVARAYVLQKQKRAETKAVLS